MTRRPLTVIGLLGTRLDVAARKPARWERWRPTVALCQHPDLRVDRLVLLHGDSFLAAARDVAADVAQVSPETTVELRTLDIRDPWDLEETYGKLYDFARSFPFDSAREDYLVHITTGTHIAQISMFLLVESRRLPARLLQTAPDSRRGDSVGSYSIIDLDLSRYDGIARRFEAERVEGRSLLKAGIDTRNATYNSLIEQLERVAIASRDPILLAGPTGSGKSRLARQLFEIKKARRQVRGELVEVNCATVRGDAAMSTLFGHVRGAFTGAADARAGMLRKADGGVLFLDEIGELGLDEQAMLLRAIEDKTFYPLGSDREVHSDFQLIAGTNRDLVEAVVAGRFRDDLLARIHVWTFTLPALRDRPEDLAPNLDVEIDRLGIALQRRITVSRQARDAFLKFARSPSARWTANFRDFAASVRRMATLCDGGRIAESDVADEIARLEHAWRSSGRPGNEQADHPANDGVVSPARRESRGMPAQESLAAQLVGRKRYAHLDRFDRVQLDDVVAVCARATSLSDAGRTLYAQSRVGRRSVNDADRVRKYLARHGLTFAAVRAAIHDG